jgi:hypothetical protein
MSESYTASDALPPIVPACRQPLLPACVFVNRDTVRHPRLFFQKICSWTDLFVMRSVREPRFHCTYKLKLLYVAITACSLFQTTFGERGIVLCLFNIHFLYNLTHGLPTWYGLFSLLCILYASLFCDIVILCYCFSSVYCTVYWSCIVLCLLVMYVLLP